VRRRRLSFRHGRSEDDQERLSWRVSQSCGCAYDVLTLDHREAADVMSVPAGWATRNYLLKFEVKGAYEVLPTREEAMRIAEAWFLALDIEPWN
jgi:hypothetical protein